MIRRLIAACAALVACVAVASPAVAGPAVKSVGVAKRGQTALEFVAKVDQAGPTFTFYGYLTFVRGLPDSVLFSTPGADQSEATSRITFFGTTTLVARSIIDNVFVVTSVGTINFYLNPSGGSFADPGSFARGQSIASHGVRFQNIINVQGSGGPPPVAGRLASSLVPLAVMPMAISIGTGGLTQLSASVFSAGGKQYRLGRRGLEQRIFATGEGTLLEPTQPRSAIVLGGNATISG